MSPIERPLRVAAVGDNCIDLFLPPLGYRLVGGNAVNVAVALAGLGAEAAYFGAVGQDADGAIVEQALRAQGVDVAHLVRRHLPTSRTTIGVDASGDRHILEEDFGACDGYAPSAAAVAILCGMDHVHIGWLNDGGALRRALAAAGVSVSQDLGVNAAPADLGVGGLAFAFASHPGTHDEARAPAARLLAAGARHAVVTRGAGGSSVFSADGAEVVQAPLPITPVDTTGAGDAYIAGFLVAVLSGASLPAAAASAGRVAAEACLFAGGFRQTARPA